MILKDVKPKAARRFTRVFAVAAALVAVAMGTTLAAAPSAFADGNPSTADLLGACSWADYCQFHADNYEGYTGPAHQVGTTAFNCANVTDSQTMTWSDETSSSNSVGVNITAGAKFEEVFEFEVQTTYSHTWTTYNTTSQSDTENIPSKYVGWIERGTPKQKAEGWYELHFSKPYYGHYIWYIENYTESGYNADNTNGGYISFHDRAMTSAERKEYGC